MANQSAIAYLLIVTGIVLLAVLNQLSWLVWLIPLALLFSVAISSRSNRNNVARELKKG